MRGLHSCEVDWARNSRTFWRLPCVKGPVGKRFHLDNAQGPLVQIVGVAKTGKYVFISRAAAGVPSPSAFAKPQIADGSDRSIRRRCPGPGSALA